MGEARRRHLKALETGTPVQPKKPRIYGLIEAPPVDQQQPDGSVVRIPIFHIADENGVRAVNTPAGPVPLAIAGVPILLKAASGLIVPAAPLPKVPGG